MEYKGNHKNCYASLSNPSLKEAIALHNFSILKLAVLVSEFAQQLAAAYELFSKEVQAIITTFRRRNTELKKQRPVDTSNSIFNAWESLLLESELDAQAHLDAAGLLMKNVFRPLQEVASHKNRQADVLSSYRDNFESVLSEAVREATQAEAKYHSSFQEFACLPDSSSEQGEQVRGQLHNSHNEYILKIRASNRTVDEFNSLLPQLLEELEEIYIDTGNTINVAFESQALLLLTKADEQHRRYENQMKICKMVSPHQDVSFFVRASQGEGPALTYTLSHYVFKPAIAITAEAQKTLSNQIIYDRLTESNVIDKRTALQTQGMGLAVNLKQSQDIIATLSNICQRNLARHQYTTVYEAQLEMCRKRNEIRLANLLLAAVKAQVGSNTPGQFGSLGER
ncbi:uncharacterized protein LOC131929270 [Physella acuta]|uniref:uncharacterized protein LOC131929270 n=1 Tax=Physella acuta TaxID=109671 RepID=UPI0027DB6CB0|nr:uncharacterized protein LOC131929270 [Physella acuta]